ncbi:MAG: hypothetical protein WDN75_15860 [Bacteroidota bacterium]
MNVSKWDRPGTRCKRTPGSAYDHLFNSGLLKTLTQPTIVVVVKLGACRINEFILFRHTPKIGRDISYQQKYPPRKTGLI